MKEIFLEYAKKGAMTKEEVGKVLNLSPDMIRRMAKSGKIPRLSGMWCLRFDPLAVYEALTKIAPARSGSLTIERRKTSASLERGVAKCL